MQVSTTVGAVPLSGPLAWAVPTTLMTRTSVSATYFTSSVGRVSVAHLGNSATRVRRNFDGKYTAQMQQKPEPTD